MDNNRSRSKIQQTGPTAIVSNWSKRQTTSVSRFMKLWRNRNRHQGGPKAIVQNLPDRTRRTCLWFYQIGPAAIFSKCTKEDQPQASQKTNRNDQMRTSTNVSKWIHLDRPWRTLSDPGRSWATLSDLEHMYMYIHIYYLRRSWTHLPHFRMCHPEGMRI